MSVIAPRDTAPRYKSLFPYGERRSVPFFTGYPEDRDLASIISQDGDARRRGVTRTHMRLHFRMIRRTEFSAQRIKASANDCEMIQRKIRKKSLSGSLRHK